MHDYIRLRMICPLLAAMATCWHSNLPGAEIEFSGNAVALQQVLDGAPENATIVCQGTEPIEISKSITITRPLTLKGLKARLPDKLGRTPMIVVSAPRVSLVGLELHGNYESVDQVNRAPMIWLQRGEFTVRSCKFYDGSKDGVMVTPVRGSGDIVGGTIRDIQAHRMGRDAVSISGGNQGQKVRELTVENVTLRRGYYRGSVEVSDGTDKITVRHVQAFDAVYAIDVQDHRGNSAANTNVTIEDIRAENCRHVIRTANSPRGHANLVVRQVLARNCSVPVKISNTKNVVLEQVRIECKPEAKSAPITLVNCDGVRLQDVTLEGLAEGREPIEQKKCSQVVVAQLVR